MNTLGFHYPQVSHPWIQPNTGWNFKISVGWIFRCESWGCGSWLYFVTIISMKLPKRGGPTIIRLLPYKAMNQSELAQASSLVLVAQSCPTLCDPRDCSLPGSSVHGIFQARVKEWVAISFSRASSRSGDRTQVSHIAGRCFTLWSTGTE